MNDILEKRYTIDELISLLNKELPSLKEKYSVEFLGIFGSYIRGEQKEGSDLDLLISFNKVPSLFEYIRLEEYLSSILNIKVDLVMKDTLKPAIGKHILNEVVEI